MSECAVPSSAADMVIESLRRRAVAAEVAALGYRQRAERAEALLGDVRGHIGRGYAPCPLCQGSVRETSGMRCALCGTEYAEEPT